MDTVYEKDYVTIPMAAETIGPYTPAKDIPKLIKKLKREMSEAAKNLEFERAAELRDRIFQVEREALDLGGTV